MQLSSTNMILSCKYCYSWQLNVRTHLELDTRISRTNSKILTWPHGLKSHTGCANVFENQPCVFCHTVYIYELFNAYFVYIFFELICMRVLLLCRQVNMHACITLMQTRVSIV